MMTIVMSVFGRAVLTEACLTSVRETAPDARLIVIDNGSGPETQDVLRRCAPYIDVLIQARSNYGKPWAWNTGWAVAEQACAIQSLCPPEWITFLDNDVQLIPGWTVTLATARAALPAPLGILTGLGDGVLGSPLKNGAIPVQFPHGLFMSISCAALRHVGGLETNCFIGGVDDRIAVRLSRLGYGHYQIPGLAIHRGAAQRSWNPTNFMPVLHP